MNILKQSTAVTINAGPFLDDTDGKTAEIALTIATADVRLSKNGGANGAKNSTTATNHNELGYYNIHLSATDTNTLGALKVMISMAGALPVWADFMVVTANVYDTLFSTGKFEVNLASGHGLLEADDYTAPDNAGITAIKGKTDNLPASPAAVGSEMKLENNAITADKIAASAITDAKISSDAVYKIQDGTALEATLSEIKGANWASDDNLHNLSGKADETGNRAENIEQDIQMILNSSLPEVLQAIDDKPVTPATDISDLPTKDDLEASEGNIIEAIEDKPVTPETDISNLATKLDLDVLAKAADLDELLTMLTTVANDTGTTVPQLVASLPAKVWSYPFRTLTVSAIRPQTLLEGDQFSIYKDTSILIPITALGDISAYDNLWFTAKKEMDLQDGDEKAIIHIDLLTGLLYINQEVADNALGGIRVDDSEAGNIDIWLSKNASALLPLFSKETLRWEVKGISGDNVDILLQGTNYILPAVTRKIS